MKLLNDCELSRCRKTHCYMPPFFVIGKNKFGETKKFPYLCSIKINFMTKTFKFNQLSKAAKEYCLKMQKKYNFKKLTDEQIIEKIKDWDFVSNGSMYNGLTN